MSSKKRQLVNQCFDLCILLDGSKGWSRTKRLVYGYKLKEFIKAFENTDLQRDNQEALDWLRSQGTRNSPEQIGDKIWGICMSLLRTPTPA